MSWGEAIRLTRLLRVDTGTQVAAALEGWDYPLARSEAYQLDLFDLTHQAHSTKRPAPHPGRPWGKHDSRRFGDRAGRSREQVVAILRRHGHDIN